MYTNFLRCPFLLACNCSERCQCVSYLIRGGWTHARECVLHIYIQLIISRCKSTQFSILYYSQMDNVLLLNSGGCVVQLDITDSGSRPVLTCPPKNLEQAL